jgi:RNA polymerase sigma factor (sigma-70 family)
VEHDSSPLTSREIAETFLQEGEQRSRLFAYARSHFGIDSSAAEDLLQETAIELMRQRSLVRSPSGFVFHVFHTRCCRYLQTLRAEQRTIAWSDRSEVSAGEPQAESIARRIALREIFETVSSSCRRILLAYYVEGKSLRETAQAIALPYSGVWNTINRCLRRLRSCLEP